MSLKQIKVIECINSHFINSAKMILIVWKYTKQFFHLAGTAKQQKQLPPCPVLIVLK